MNERKSEREEYCEGKARVDGPLPLPKISRPLAAPVATAPQLCERFKTTRYFSKKLHESRAVFTESIKVYLIAIYSPPLRGVQVIINLNELYFKKMNRTLK